MLEIDTELMKVVDEFANFDLLKPKDRFSPSFWTQETDSMFIISAQLKGYRRTNIKVERNEDGSRITVSGEKSIQDMLMIGGKVVKKNIETQGFHKSFKILEGMVLDKVKVKFNEDDSKLMIRIPKVTKGFMGVAIDELKTEEIPSESSKLLQVYTNGELSEHENQEIEEENVQDLLENVKDGGLQGNNEFRHDKQEKENLKQEQVKTNHVARKEVNGEQPKSHRRRFKICKPLIFGSAFFISLIVMVFHLVQSEKPEKRKKKTDQD
ncbi:hypothetical protein L6452_38852 [Arctium lappa]|uniref:Uncharacterized protein n=1 Tax=Arctium lappa TaxID=4217 RepID=A0ACB8XUS2_ARCLA|nr:hypothetical protein L6452_38852 [Arctium lappa]